MASKIASNVVSVLGFLESHSGSFLNVITTLFTVFGQSFISDYLFRCPCLNTDQTSMKQYLDQSRTTWKQVYSLVFIIIPALALLCLSLVVNNETKRCLSVHFRSGGRHCLSLKYFMSRIAASAFVAPSAWITVVLLDGRYLECCLAAIPSLCIATNNDLPQNDTIREYVAGVRADNLYYQTLSQVIAWAFLCIGVLIMTLGFKLMVTKPCRLHTPYYQQEFMRQFRKLEMESFEKASAEILEKELPKKWQLFFNEASCGDWTDISGLPYEDPDTVKEKFFYSAFHKWRRQNVDADSQPYADVVAGGVMTVNDTNKPEGMEMLPLINDAKTV